MLDDNQQGCKSKNEKGEWVLTETHTDSDSSRRFFSSSLSSQVNFHLYCVKLQMALPQGALQSVQCETPCMCARRLLNICENIDPDRQQNSLRWSRLTMKRVVCNVSGAGSWSSDLPWTSSPPGRESAGDGIKDSCVFRNGEKWI